MPKILVADDRSAESPVEEHDLPRDSLPPELEFRAGAAGGRVGHDCCRGRDGRAGLGIPQVERAPPSSSPSWKRAYVDYLYMVPWQVYYNMTRKLVLRESTQAGEHVECPISRPLRWMTRGCSKRSTPCRGWSSSRASHNNRRERPDRWVTS